MQANGLASIQSRSYRRVALATSLSHAATLAVNFAFLSSYAAQNCSRCLCFTLRAVSLGNLSGFDSDQRISPHHWAKRMALPAASMSMVLWAGIVAPVMVHLKWVKRGQLGKSFGTRLTQEYAC